MDFAGSDSVVPSGNRQSHCHVISRTHWAPFQVNSIVRGMESFLGGGGSLTVAGQTPAVHFEVIETLVRCANSGWRAAMLMPDFALAPNVRTYCPFQSGSAANAAGASDSEPASDVAAKAITAVLRRPDIVPPRAALPRRFCSDVAFIARVVTRQRLA